MINPLSKNECKSISSLKIKKYRQQEKLFLVEGEKMVMEAITTGMVHAIIATNDWWRESNRDFKGIKCFIADVNQIKKISEMVTPPPVIAVVGIPSCSFTIEDLKGKITIALDNIQDPGNLGTIIRLADWFGIENILCTVDCVDRWNFKVIQASMGSIFRVHVHYVDLREIFFQLKKINIFLIGALLSGENIYTTELPKEGILLLGNESKGISNELLSFVNKKITIPYVTKKEGRAESLNVAVAASIICSEWMRRLHWI